MNGSKNGNGKKAPPKLAPREQAILDVLDIWKPLAAPVAGLYEAYMRNVPKKVKRAKDARSQQQVVGSVIVRIHKKRASIRIKPGSTPGVYKLTRNRPTA